MKFTQTLLQKIFTQHQLGEVWKVQDHSTGIVNPIKIINDVYVLKVNIRDPASPKLQREALAFNLLKNTDVLVPTCMVLDNSRACIPYDFMIMTKMEGQEILTHWQEISSAAQNKLAHEAGQLLAQIHQISLPKFGDLILPSLQFATWDAYLQHLVRATVKDCQQFQLFDAAVLSTFQQLFKENRQLWEAVASPSLVHVDYHFNNLLYHQNRISSVLDFEWAIAGDPEFDLNDIYSVLAECPGSETPFMEGYTTVRTLSKHFKSKYLLYRLYGCFFIATVSKQHWGSAKTVKNQQIALDALQLAKKHFS